MSKYEYDYVSIELSDEQRHLLELGLNISEINSLIKPIINERAKDGWKPLWPFTLPDLWFERTIPARRKNTKTN